jgi:hypothetical protein
LKTAGRSFVPRMSPDSDIIDSEDNGGRISRRLLICRSVPVTLAAVAAGGLAWRVSDTNAFRSCQGPAYAAWKNWPPPESDGPMPLVRAAILAANPHNTQPWLFHVAPSQIDLYADPRQALGSIDPFLREMHIGLGCALENLVLAAEARGYEPVVRLMPSPSDPTHVARVEIHPGHRSVSRLYQAIPRRHTNRGPYDTTRKLQSSIIAALAALNRDADLSVRWFTDGADGGEYRALGACLVAATEAIAADPDQIRDSGRWLRLQQVEIDRRRNGVTLDASGLPAPLRVAAKLAPSLAEDPNLKHWVRMTRDTHVRTAAAFGSIAARDPHDVQQRLRAGQLWQRMHLWATANGLAMQPMNQMNERADREQSLAMRRQPYSDTLRRFMGDAGWHALMAFRAGYPSEEALPSPRRFPEELLV